jgi:hypothetical protein
MTFRPLSAWVLEARLPLVDGRVPIGKDTTTREAIVATRGRTGLSWRGGLPCGPERTSRSG